jgi:acetylornithine/N-succinyldiaminopimelate aminotransferase
MPCAELVKKALAEGLLINVTAESVIRLLPPLILNVEESQMIVDKVSKLVLEFLSSQQVESVA